MFDYCKNCSHNECRYIEVNEFVCLINRNENKKYRLISCPDKNGSTYTCDMLLFNDKTGEKIYLEIKEVKYGFGTKKEQAIYLGENKCQFTCANIVSSVINEIDKDSRINDFIIKLPRAKIKGSATAKMRSDLVNFIKTNSFKDDNYTFISDDNYRISFTRKGNNRIDKNIFAFENIKDNTIKSIQSKLVDTKSLIGLLEKNFNNTSNKKFPSGAKRRILLNVLKLPYGYDLLFNLNMASIFSIISNSCNNIVTSASESYLLYYCEDYYQRNFKSIKSIGKQLFCVPLKCENPKGITTIDLNTQ